MVRMFTGHLIKYSLDEEDYEKYVKNSLYLITSDADLFPLDPYSHSIPAGQYDWLLTHPLRFSFEKKPGSCFVLEKRGKIQNLSIFLGQPIFS